MQTSYQHRRPGSAERAAARAGVAGDEFVNRMHTVSAVGRSRRWIPAFANDAAQLRSVIIHTTLGYIFRNEKIPADVATDLAYLKELAADREAWTEACAQGSLSAHWQAQEEFICAVKDCGGYLAMLGAIAYRAWRLNWHARDIAASLAMQTTAVKAILQRLLSYADRLGFPTYAPRKDATPVSVHEVIASMWRNSATVEVISEILGRTRSFVRQSLRVQGLYKLRRKTSRLSTERRVELRRARNHRWYAKRSHNVAAT